MVGCYIQIEDTILNYYFVVLLEQNLPEYLMDSTLKIEKLISINEIEQ